MTKRGSFILFEGCDKSGKSTQSSALVARLNSMSIPAELVRFPGKQSLFLCAER